MRKSLLIAALALNAAAAGLLWQVQRDRAQVQAFLSSFPPVPDLAGWPRVFVDRLRLDTTAVAQGGSDALGALKELALLYHANGFSPEAEKLERAIRRRAPSDAQWTYYLADSCLTAGDTEEAQTLLNETLRLKPDYAPAELKLADLLLRFGRYPEAQRHYEARLRKSPGDPYSQLGLARIALQSDDWPRAQTALETLVQSAPAFSTAHNLLAELYRARGETEKAAEQSQLGSQAARFREAEDPWMAQLAEWSYDPYRLQVLGATEMQTGHLEASLPFYEKSVSLNPSDGTAYDALADVYLRLNRLADARKTLEAGLAAAPKTRELYSTLSQVLRKEQRTQETVTLLQRGLTLFPENPELFNDLGVALDEMGRHAEAVQAYRSAVRLNPEFAQAHLNLGLCLLELGDQATAQASIGRALELRPSDSTALLVMAQTELDAGRTDSAARFARMLREFRPQQPEPRHLLALANLQWGTAASRRGETAEAEHYFRAGLQEDNTVPELQANLGAILSQRGNYTEALPFFQQFVALAPNEPTAYLYLGQVYLATSRTKEAAETFERGLQFARDKGDTEAQARLESLLAQTRGE